MGSHFIIRETEKGYSWLCTPIKWIFDVCKKKKCYVGTIPDTAAAAQQLVCSGGLGHADISSVRSL